MFVPSMYDLHHVMAESGYTEEQVFDLGISERIVYLVVVPEVGACRVPIVALSHFMAGADEYSAEGMPEHYSSRLSGKWTIKRDRLRILADSWEKYSDECLELADLLDLNSNARPPNDQTQPAQEQEIISGKAPMPLMRAQEEGILTKLKELGYSPLALPKNDAGKPGVKAEVRSALGNKGIWAKTTVFKKAWERLTAYGEIKIIE